MKTGAICILGEVELIVHSAELWILERNLLYFNKKCTQIQKIFYVTFHLWIVNYHIKNNQEDITIIYLKI